MKKSEAPSISYRAVTRESLPDLATFSGCHGKFGYCSCMRWRMKSADYSKSTKEARSEKLMRMVRDGIPVGVLAYSGETPIGWCSIAPRATYEGLERYKALPRIDTAEVWSVVCFFVDRNFRRKKVTHGLLRAAVDYARSAGALIVEGYPVNPVSNLYTYMGAPSIFEALGFRDVTPRGQARKVMRLHV